MQSLQKHFHRESLQINKTFIRNNKKYNQYAVKTYASLPIVRKPDGQKSPLPKEVCIIGSNASSADILINNPKVSAEHAKIEYKSGRLFCTALTSADPDLLLSPTFTWIEGTELRQGVAYLVAPGARVAVGDPSIELWFEFSEQGGAGGIADMLLQGMAATASSEVQEQLKKSM